VSGCSDKKNEERKREREREKEKEHLLVFVAGNLFVYLNIKKEAIKICIIGYSHL